MEHISNFTNHFLGEICKVVKMPGQDFSKELKCDVILLLLLLLLLLDLLKIKRATKDQLSSWMEVLIFALNSHAVPLLQSISPDAQCVGQLREEKISDQSTIINLLLIDKKEVQAKKVQETVQSKVKTVQKEMKIYSAVLQKEIKTQSSEFQKMLRL